MKDDRTNLIILNKGMIEIFARYIGYYDTRDIVETIVDRNKDDITVINAAKYIMYWVEKWNIVDDPEITKYNDYLSYDELIKLAETLENKEVK